MLGKILKTSSSLFLILQYFVNQPKSHSCHSLLLLWFLVEGYDNYIRTYTQVLDTTTLINIRNLIGRI